VEMRNKEIRSILGYRFTLQILQKIHNGYRPSQIAKSLGISDQNLYYYVKHLKYAKLIKKNKEGGYVIWKLTAIGILVLKELISDINKVPFFINQSK
jgi:predicted transcriptional regulator